jgi:uncharacterized protein (TIGR00369 family)
MPTAPAGDSKIGVVAPETLKSRSGLDFLRGIIEGTLPQPPITATLGYRLVAAAPGFAAFEGEPEWRHYNPLGSVHAGFAETLLDSCMACAVHTTVEKGFGYTTLELKVNLVRAITDKTGKVRAEGRVLHAGRRTATAEGKLFDAGGTLLAHGTTTCLIFPL